MCLLGCWHLSVSELGNFRSGLLHLAIHFSDTHAPTAAGDPLLAATPSMAQALAAVRGTALDTHAPHKMQSALQQRLEGFPGRAAESMHVAHALVPARVAHLLRCEPQLLAAAVEAFHYRIPDDVKVQRQGAGVCRVTAGFASSRGGPGGSASSQLHSKLIPAAACRDCVAFGVHPAWCFSPSPPFLLAPVTAGGVQDGCPASL